MKKFPSARGQAMVETVIVMPLFIFIILSLIQMTQVYQAYSMLKYAAYRAARAGSLNNMKTDKMLHAGLLTMLPVDTSAGSIQPVNTGTLMLYGKSNVSGGSLSLNFAGRIAHSLVGEEQMKVLICNPAKSWVQNNYMRSVDGSTGSGEVDFDDPRNTYGMKTGPELDKYREVTAETTQHNFERTKLTIQLQYRHRLVIPFVNGIIYDLVNGKNVMNELRLNKRQAFNFDLSGLTDRHKLFGIYTLFMYANYALRMQSNFLIDNLPASDGGDCLSYKNKT